MSRSTPALCVAALLAWFASGCQTDDAGRRVGGETPLAEVHGETITQGEVDEWIRDDLFRKATEDKNAGQLYELRAAALARLIEERVLEREASENALSEEQLVAREIEALGPVSDAEVDAWYEENKARVGDLTLETARPHIRKLLEGKREESAVRAIVERAGVVVYLERPRVEVTADGPSRGPDDARVTIVEFSDFQCPYCKRSASTLESVLERYPDDVRLVYRHLPLDSIHPRARPAALASVCADAQGKFWTYHDLLFENAGKLGDDDLKRYAGQAGLDLERFDQCLGEDSTRERVQTDAADAARFEIHGTPAFFVNGIPLSGARPASAFIEVIEEELALTDESRS